MLQIGKGTKEDIFRILFWCDYERWGVTILNNGWMLRNWNTVKFSATPASADIVWTKQQRNHRSIRQMTAPAVAPMLITFNHKIKYSAVLHKSEGFYSRFHSKWILLVVLSWVVLLVLISARAWKRLYKLITRYICFYYYQPQSMMPWHTYFSFHLNCAQNDAGLNKGILNQE